MGQQRSNVRGRELNRTPENVRSRSPEIKISDRRASKSPILVNERGRSPITNRFGSKVNEVAVPRTAEKSRTTTNRSPIASRTLSSLHISF